jgi:hypothetical protein
VAGGQRGSKLVSKDNLGTIASQKIVIKVGAKRREISKEGYARAVDNGKKSNIELPIS